VKPIGRRCSGFGERVLEIVDDGEHQLGGRERRAHVDRGPIIRDLVDDA
jgi:hypothetical protein